MLEIAVSFALIAVGIFVLVIAYQIYKETKNDPTDYS